MTDLRLQQLQDSAAADVQRLRAQAAQVRAERTTTGHVATAKPCRRCAGSGVYANIGICFRCGGHGRETKPVERPLTAAEIAANDDFACGLDRAAERAAGRIARRAARMAARS